ncbi:MAG: 50S ribosomal protein L9 [Verrucomicrobia bacterium]|nr:50S ribosomal protein L9 [Verrucomicrobiota bacterium]
MNQEVILKSPVKGLGAEADMVRVKPGYARNYLFPRGLATPVNASSKRQIESLKKRRQEREVAEAAATQERAAKLAKLALAFELKQSQEGAEKLFGAITATEIAAALADKGFEVDRRDVIVPKAINHVGEHDVTVDLGYSVKVQIKVKVTGNTDENFERPAKSRRPKKTAAAEEPDKKS